MTEKSSAQSPPEYLASSRLKKPNRSQATFGDDSQAVRQVESTITPTQETVTTVTFSLALEPGAASAVLDSLVTILTKLNGVTLLSYKLDQGGDSGQSVPENLDCNEPCVMVGSHTKHKVFLQDGWYTYPES